MSTSRSARSSSETQHVRAARPSPPRAARAPSIARSRASSISRSSMSFGQLDREHAEVAGVRVELDGRVARGAGRLLVGGEERVLERLDQRVLLDPLLALDRLDRLDDLSAHLTTLRRSRLPRTIASYGMSTRSPSAAASCTERSSAATSSPRKRFRPPISSAVRSATLRPTRVAEVRRRAQRPLDARATRRRPCTGRDSRAARR